MSHCNNKCKGCPKLKVVEKPPQDIREIQDTSFWNSCPRKLEQLPTEHCHLGKPEKNKKGRVTKEPECPWWIDSPEHNYCFWTYVRENSSPDGRMDPMMQNEIAKMLGCSSTKIHFILKEAIEKIRRGPYAHVLEDFAASADSRGELPEPSLDAFDSDDLGSTDED